MGRTKSWMRSREFYYLVGLGLLFGVQAGKAQTQPPDMPINLISPIIPYQQGLANIEAQGAARPQAVQPILPSAASALPGAPASPVVEQTNPEKRSQPPAPR